MKRNAGSSARPLVRAGLLALLVCMLAPAGAAEGAKTSATPADTAEQRYRQERAECLSGRSPQPRAVCLQEAGAARDEARRQGLSSPNADFTRNQRQRCEALPPADSKACMARMAGEGSTRGSVAEGGVIRELTTRTTGAPQAASAPSPAASGGQR